MIATKDYARQYQAIWPEIEATLRATMLEDDPILGASVQAFEQELAAWHGVAEAVGVGSGTDALVACLRGLGIGPGAEVVTSGHTFSGVISAILLAGAVPVLVDPDPDSGQLGAVQAEAALSPRTRALLAVHLHGHPADLDGLVALARARDLRLIEDVAQAHGATWRDQPVGGFGDAAALSFHPSKNLGAFGDGGAILCPGPELATRLRIGRNLGKQGKYRFVHVSANSKLDTLQAAILRVKLRHLPVWLDRRRQLAARYRQGLAGAGDLLLPPERPGAGHAWHLYVVHTDRRDALRDFLAGRGIGTSLHYPVAAHRQPAFAQRLVHGPLPETERRAATCLTLPLSHEHEDAEIDAVIDAVRAFFGAGR